MAAVQPTLQPLAYTTLTGLNLGATLAGLLFFTTSEADMSQKTAFKSSLAAIALLMPLLAHADAAQDAAAKEYIGIAHMDTLLPGMAQQATGSSVPLLQEYFVKNKISLNPTQQKSVQAGLKGYVDRQHKLAMDYFSTPKSKQELESGLIKSYTAQFSTEELKQMAAFYKTPAGQKVLKLQGPIIDGVAGTMLKNAEKTLLPQMQSAAATYGKSIVK
jgi:hypothetical protein